MHSNKTILPLGIFSLLTLTAIQTAFHISKQRKLLKCRKSMQLTEWDGDNSDYVCKIRPMLQDVELYIDIKLQNRVSTNESPYTSCTFAGGGFRTMSYYGYVRYLVKTQLIDGRTKFYGTSLGALWAIIGTIYTTDMEDTLKESILEHIYITMFKYISNVHVDWWHSFGNLHHWVRKALSIIPEELLPIFQDRCNISITVVFPLPVHNLIVSKYASIDDLINACISSMAIPHWTKYCSIVLPFRQQYAVDGGFTNNCVKPKIDKSKGDHHITVFDYKCPWIQVFDPPSLKLSGYDRNIETSLRSMRQEFLSGVDMCIERIGRS